MQPLTVKVIKNKNEIQQNECLFLNVITLSRGKINDHINLLLDKSKTTASIMYQHFATLFSLYLSTSNLFSQEREIK